MWSSKDVYYISDGTGILANTLGKSLICQFPEINFHEEQFPFVDTVAEAEKTMAYIKKESCGRSPIIFSTVLDPKIIDILDSPEVVFFDAFTFFLEKMEDCLEANALRAPGFSRKVDNSGMDRRVQAIHYCMEHDDGTGISEYDEADVILLGVSRAGKTPISVYIASQMALKTANFPLTEEYLSNYKLPNSISRNAKRAIGLTTTPQVLRNVREKRYGGSKYADLATCKNEIYQAEQIFMKNQIPIITTAGKSIEETATQVMQALNLSKTSTRLIV